MADQTFKIGDRVRFQRGYSRKTVGRFEPILSEKNPKAQQMRLVPCRIEDVGYVVGTRVVVMSDAVYKPGYTHDAAGMFGPPEFEPGSLSGHREKVLLVTIDIRKEPFIVRIAEAEKL